MALHHQKKDFVMAGEEAKREEAEQGPQILITPPERSGLGDSRVGLRPSCLVWPLPLPNRQPVEWDHLRSHK